MATWTQAASGVGASSPEMPPWCQAIAAKISSGASERPASSAPAYAWSTPSSSRSSSARRAPIGSRRASSLERVLAERDRHHELADVVQQAGEVRDLDRGAGAPRGARRAAGDRDGVHVHLPARDAALPGRALEEAIDLGLEREPRERAPADHRHRLADRLRAHDPRQRGRVGEPQQVRRERLVALDHRDELVGGAVGIVGELTNGPRRSVQDRQPSDRLQGALQSRLDLRLHSGITASIIGI